MLIEVTIEKMVGGFAIVTALGTWAFSIFKTRFVSRKEWHDTNNHLAGVVGTIQQEVASIHAQLSSGDARMGSLESHIQAVDQSSRNACEGIARIEGILLGQEYQRNKARA